MTKKNKVTHGFLYVNAQNKLRTYFTEDEPKYQGKVLKIEFGGSEFEWEHLELIRPENIIYHIVAIRHLFEEEQIDDNFIINIPKNEWLQEMINTGGLDSVILTLFLEIDGKTRMIGSFDELDFDIINDYKSIKDCITEKDKYSIDLINPIFLNDFLAFYATNQKYQYNEFWNYDLFLALSIANNMGDSCRILFPPFPSDDKEGIKILFDCIYKAWFINKEYKYNELLKVENSEAIENIFESLNLKPADLKEFSNYLEDLIFYYNEEILKDDDKVEEFIGRENLIK
jgi:hypothetical protein